VCMSTLRLSSSTSSQRSNGREIVVSRSVCVLEPLAQDGVMVKEYTSLSSRRLAGILLHSCHNNLNA
jgi:hypothetical protein